MTSQNFENLSICDQVKNIYIFLINEVPNYSLLYLGTIIYFTKFWKPHKCGKL